VTTQEEVYDLVFTTGVLAALHDAAKALIDRGLDDAASIVLATPHPTREGIDLSDIPEATAEDFAGARLVLPS
jgi:hypothetical protein